MHELTGRESLNNENNSDQDASESDSEATSKETLEDIETGEADTGSGAPNSDPGPSPDGALDESDELKDAGPM